MKTFVELYKFLQKYKKENIYEWLEEKWEGKDKQESLLRIFSSLKLIKKLEEYEICKGNYNLGTIEKYKNIQEIFYDEKGKEKKLKDKGDSSDLTGISKKNDKKIVVTTSKNIKKMNIGKLDIEKIITNNKKYEEKGYETVICICIRKREKYEKMKRQIEKTNREIKEIINKKSTIIIDWEDLNKAYKIFKKKYSEKEIKEIIWKEKEMIELKMHQELGVKKTMKMKKEEKKKKILWGHIQRSGKSYIICGSIIEDSKEKKECNYLIITTAPNETIEQQKKVLECEQLKEFNIIVLNGENEKPEIKEKNIILCSKQYLQSKIENKTKNILWLRKMKIEMRFIDESHNGGTTELAKKTLEYYGKEAFTVQITATYSKPINDYKIPKENWILWDLEDIKLCKKISEKKNKERLEEKHGEIIKEIIKNYTEEERYSLEEEYKKYPDLWILTEEIKKETVEYIKTKTRNNEYGWSIEGCFILKQGIKEGKKIIKNEFQNEKEALKIWHKIFGKRDEMGIPDDGYPDKKVYMKRIEKICKNSILRSRCIGEGEMEKEPMIIMGFLPQNNINEISEATKKLLEKNKVIPEYEIVSINSKKTNNPKKTIEEARIIAKNNNKKGVLVLSGRQCSLGVSIKNCDIVLLLNNNTSFDMIYQMMFRSMTEGKNKKYGFVVDLNIQRVIETSIINYASIIKPEKHPKKAIKYILNEKLINLNGDHWMEEFGKNKEKINRLCENIYNIYSSNTEKALNHYLNRLRFKEILLSKNEQTLFNAIFKIGKPTKEQNEEINKLNEEINKDIEDINENNIKKGIEKEIIEDELMESETEEKDKKENESKKEKKNVNYMEILKHIIPLICLLTIHETETTFIEMYKIIENNNYVYKILLDQTKSWWGKNIDNRILKIFINIYIKYKKKDKETNQIIRTVKELFMKNINNSKELSKLIDKYLIPQELEKKTNAEVSTPYKLRQEMLDKIPKKFWRKKRKVFEPCAGKGGFVIDIIDRFMEGLKEKYPDEKKRYKRIVERCIYFSDINPTNIYICKLLIDPYNEYKLKYNEGDTLELDIKEKWGIEGFDGVIGNPPYNSNNKRTTGVTLWQKFIKKSIEQLNKNGYLCFVNPASWRKPVTDKCKYNNNLYKLMSHSNQIIYLSIHNTKDGMKTFKCGTRYDWYIIKKKKADKKTIINDENNKIIKINMLEYEWIPNYNYKLLNKISKGNKKLNIIYSRTAYGADKKWMKKKKNNEFIYPCIHTTPINNVRYMYSNNNKNGHFNIPKVIIGDSNINPVLDYKGIYGLTNHSFGIIIETKEEGENIKKALLTEKFKSFIKACSWSNYQIDWRLFTYLNKDFWKEFINENGEEK